MGNEVRPEPKPEAAPAQVSPPSLEERRKAWMDGLIRNMTTLSALHGIGRDEACAMLAKFIGWQVAEHPVAAHQSHIKAALANIQLGIADVQKQRREH